VDAGDLAVTAQSPYTQRSTSIQFTAQRVDYVFQRRRIWATLVFRDKDQLDIARSVMGYGIGLSGLPAVDVEYLAIMQPLPVAAAIPWMTFDSTLSGCMRTRDDNDDGYRLSKSLRVSEAVTGLLQLEDMVPYTRRDLGLIGAFDYRLDYLKDPDDGSLSVKVRLGYPRLGQATPTKGFEYPGNIAEWAVATDTDDTENYTRVFGAGEGAIKLVGAIATDTAALSHGMPLLMGSENSNAVLQTTADEQGRERLRFFGGYNEGRSLAVPQTELGSYELGDNVWFRVRNKRFGDQPIGAVVRLTGHRVEPSRRGRAGRVVPILETVQ
jgi:hypothetical protein